MPWILQIPPKRLEKVSLGTRIAHIAPENGSLERESFTGAKGLFSWAVLLYISFREGTRRARTEYWLNKWPSKRATGFITLRISIEFYGVLTPFVTNVPLKRDPPTPNCFVWFPVP